MVHGSKSNESEKFRYAQFFKAFPSTPMDDKRRSARKKKLEKIVEDAGFQPSMTELGMKMFGFKEWKEE